MKNRKRRYSIPKYFVHALKTLSNSLIQALRIDRLIYLCSKKGRFRFLPVRQYGNVRQNLKFIYVRISIRNNIFNFYLLQFIHKFLKSEIGFVNPLSCFSTTVQCAYHVRGSPLSLHSTVVFLQQKSFEPRPPFDSSIS